MKTATYTVKLSRATHKNLAVFLEQQRQLWNASLEQKVEAYKKKGLFPSFFDQCKQLTELRKHESDFSQFNLHCQRSILNRLNNAFQNFFRRVKNGEKPGFPRFKGKHRRINSFDITNPTIKTVNKHKVLCIKGIGKFRFKADDLPEIKSARLVVTPRRVKVQLVIETKIVETQNIRNPLGIDVGIKNQITLSNGFQKETQRRYLREAKRRQRLHSKAIKGSTTRLKKKVMLAKSWQKVRETERGHLHELTRELITRYSSKFYIEDLKIKNMVKNRKLSRSIHEQMWGTFAQLLTYKAEDAGGWVKKVNPKNTSQRCAFCHHIPDKKIGLEIRIFSCEQCGWTLNRDINASKNILQIGESNQPVGSLLRVLECSENVITTTYPGLLNIRGLMSCRTQNSIQPNLGY